MHPSDVSLWRIYRVPNCRHVKPRPKLKFVVTVGHTESDKFWGFLINSSIRPFITSKPNLLVCEAPIIATQHTILNYDSYIDCTSLYSFIGRDFHSDEGAISQTAMVAMMHAVRNCPMLKRKDKRMILTNGGENLDGI